MLKTFSRITSGFAALLGDPETEADQSGHTESVCTAMVYQLSLIGTSEEGRCILDRVARAGDIQCLWYLRSDLVKVLADCFGEQVAREHVHRITEMFRGLVPDSFMDNSGAGPRNRAR